MTGSLHASARETEIEKRKDKGTKLETNSSYPVNEGAVSGPVSCLYISGREHRCCQSGQHRFSITCPGPAWGATGAY
jgi:hypothetical protein